MTKTPIRDFSNRMYLCKQVEADAWVDCQKDKPEISWCYEIIYTWVPSQIQSVIESGWRVPREGQRLPGQEPEVLSGVLDMEAKGG